MERPNPEQRLFVDKLVTLANQHDARPQTRATATATASRDDDNDDDDDDMWHAQAQSMVQRALKKVTSLAALQH